VLDLWIACASHTAAAPAVRSQGGFTLTLRVDREGAVRIDTDHPFRPWLRGSHRSLLALTDAPLLNRDVDWDRWPVADYLAENYRHVHPSDAAAIAHHSAYYRQLDPGSVAVSVEFGAGPNLYPLMLAAAVSRLVHAVDQSAANIAYLNRQLLQRPDPSWQPFYVECRTHQPALPAELAEALSRTRLTQADVLTLPPGRYGLASMTFVAESVTEDWAEFVRFCQAFIATVHPGGHLLAAFMENMGRYRLGDGSAWPGLPVDASVIGRVFAPHTNGLTLTRIDQDPTLPEYGYTGMVFLTGRRAQPGHGQRPAIDPQPG
jgi:hypothetical protein